MQKLRKENYFPRAEKANTVPRSPLPSSHTKWEVGRSFAIHSPNGSLGIFHEWMSPRCWTPGQQQMLCLLHDQFWWPGMAVQMQKAISSCEQFIHHEGSHTKAPM